MLPKPRKGYLLLALVKNPFKQVSAIDLSELHKRNPYVWSVVIDLHDDEDQAFEKGQLVYHQRGQATCTPVLVDDARELVFVHTSQIVATLTPDSVPEIEERYGPEILERLHRAEAAREATGIVRANGSLEQLGLGN